MFFLASPYAGLMRESLVYHSMGSAGGQARVAKWEFSFYFEFIHAALARSPLSRIWRKAFHGELVAKAQGTT